MRREANLWRGAILLPIPGEGGLQPIVCCQPARSSKGGFSGCVARLFFWLCRQVVFLAVSPGCFLAVSPGGFSGCVARLFFWLCRQVVFLAVSPGCFLAVSPGGFSGCVARLFFWLCRQVVFLAMSPGCFLAVSPGLLLTVSSGGFWLVLPGFVFLTFVSVS